MHELSLAEHLHDAVLAHVEQHAPCVVQEVILQIGTLAAVDHEALTTAFSVLSEGGVLRNTSLVIDVLVATGRCCVCGKEQIMAGQYVECVLCQQGYLTAISGTEMLIKRIVIEKQG